MKNNKLVLGLDMGISSLGWAINKYDATTDEWDIDDFGVRIWNTPEDPKSLDSSTAKRREFRSSRRILARRKQRLDDLKELFIKDGLLTKEEIDQHFAKLIEKGNNYNSENYDLNPLELRYKGLKEELTPLQLLISLINICKRRGYNNKFDFEGVEEASKDERASLDEANELIKKYKYPIIAIFESDTLKKDNYRNNKINPKKEKNNGLTDEQIKTKIENQNIVLFRRKHFEEETNALLKIQSNFETHLDSSFAEKIIEIIFRQRDFEDGPGPKDDEIKAKWEENLKAHNLSNNIYTSFHEAVGKCTFIPEEDRNTKASILNDLNFIQNEISKILASEYYSDDKEFIKDITAKTFNNYLESLEFDRNKFNKNIDLLGKNKLSKIEGVSFAKSHLFLVKLQKEYKDFFKNNIELIDLKNLEAIKNNKIEKLGRILADYKTPTRIIEELKKQGLYYDLVDDNEKTEQKLIKFTNSCKAVSVPSNTSKLHQHNAILKQLDEGIVISKYNAELIKAKDEETIKLNIEFNKSKNFDLDEQLKRVFSPVVDFDMMKNAVVFRAINQVRLVMRAIFRKYNFEINTIVIEVASEIFNTKQERRSIENNQKNYEALNNKAKEFLFAKGIRETGENILKYKLYLSQQINEADNFAIDLYSKKWEDKIYLKDIYNDMQYEVDHIIPNSKSNDQTINNKVLTSRKNNQNKGNRTPHQYFEQILKWTPEEIKEWDKTFTSKAVNKMKRLLGSKKILNLCIQDFNHRELGFESKDLNDTRYIVSYLNSYLKIELAKLNYIDETKKVEVLFAKGKLTSKFRKYWLNDSPWGYSKPREITHFHHTIDAMILSQFSSYSRLFYYQILIVLADNYLALSKGLRKNELEIEKSHELLEDVYTELKKQYQGADKYIYLQNIETNFEKVYDIMQSTFDYKMQIKQNNIFQLVNKYNQFDPLVNNFKEKVANLIPVILTIDEKEIVSKVKKDQEGNFITYKIKEPKFVKIIKKEEWAKLNNKDEKDYPYVSYLLKNRIRGKVTSSELIQNKKKALDSEGNLRFGYIQDKNGNYWEIASYYGLHIPTLKPIYRYDLINSTEIIKGLIITPNTTFIDEKKEVLTFKGFANNGNLTICPNNQLVHSAGAANFKNKFNFWPHKNTKSYENISILNINLMGKN